MKEVQILVSDDRIFTDTGRRVPVGDDGRTVHLTMDGTDVELDLSAGSYAQLCQDLDPWLKAGHPPGEPPRVPGSTAAPGEKPGRGRHANPGLVSYNESMRAFADQHGFPYLTPGGSFYYRKNLRDAYAAHLAGEKWAGPDGTVHPGAGAAPQEQAP